MSALESKFESPIAPAPAPADKKQRVDGPGGAAAELPRRAQLVNSLRLLPTANLPLQNELSILEFLSCDELGELPFLSKDMYSLVQAFFAAMKSFNLGKLTEESDELQGADTCLSLLRFCSQLRVLDLNAEPLTRDIMESESQICDIIIRNNERLEHFEAAEYTLTMLSALSSCRNLTSFRESGLDQTASSARECCCRALNVWCLIVLCSDQFGGAAIGRKLPQAAGSRDCNRQAQKCAHRRYPFPVAPERCESYELTLLC